MSDVGGEWLLLWGKMTRTCNAQQTHITHAFKEGSEIFKVVFLVDFIPCLNGRGSYEIGEVLKGVEYGWEIMKEHDQRVPAPLAQTSQLWRAALLHRPVTKTRCQRHFLKPNARTLVPASTRMTR